jgi:hypothetical protein
LFVIWIKLKSLGTILLLIFTEKHEHISSKTTLCSLEERVGLSFSCGAHDWFVWLKSNIERYSDCMWMPVFSMYFNNVLLMLGLWLHLQEDFILSFWPTFCLALCFISQCKRQSEIWSWRWDMFGLLWYLLSHRQKLVVSFQHWILHCQDFFKLSWKYHSMS